MEDLMAILSLTRTLRNHAGIGLTCVLLLCAAPALATDGGAMATEASGVATSPAVRVQVTRLDPVTIKGRIDKPRITFVIARNFRAPTTLMSEHLWQEKLAKMATGGR